MKTINYAITSNENYTKFQNINIIYLKSRIHDMGNDLNNFSNAGENITVQNSSWTFKGISKEFEEHIKNSVPLYQYAHGLVESLSDFFIGTNAKVLDIGCSTGNLLSSISNRQKHIKDIDFYFIDEVDDMINYAKKRITRNTSHKYHFICNNICDYDLPKDVDIVISMFTIQFISPSIRQEIINRIYQSLVWGGAFFFFEKINGEDARFHEILMQNYEDYKIANGYSINEIKTKQLSLRSVLKPFSEKGNIDLLKRSGFVDIQPIFQYGLFKGLLAIK